MGDGIEYLKPAGISENQLIYFGPDKPEYEETYDGYVEGYFFKALKDAKDLHLT